MKKVIFILLFLFLAFPIGCSKNDTGESNELSIINNASAAVSVNFRGNVYRVAAGDSKTIHDISNGSFDYETAIELPAGASIVTRGTHLDGTLLFSGKTKFTLNFISNLTGAAPTMTYEINATLSSSDPETTTTTTTPAAHLLNIF